MSQGTKPKARFSTKLPNGDFLGITVWHGKTDPNAEVVTAQIRRQTGEEWQTVAKLAVYRSSDGRYSLLPERGESQDTTTPRAQTISATQSSPAAE
ncbi:MAG TPA: hypothetical protein VFE98_00850 [Candidatus Bathyarchaeia archaeon]|nr:hypothetical protein [Candidatus Bathyarchaeia archaeon]